MPKAKAPFSVKILREKGLDNFRNRRYFGKVLRIVATEDKAVFYIPFYSADKSLRDAIRGCLWAAFFKTAITFMDGFFCRIKLH